MDKIWGRPGQPQPDCSVSGRMKAVIDMGTNTFHLLLAHTDGPAGLEKVVDERVAVMLGQGGISAGRLAPEACQRGLSALAGFMEKIRAAGLEPGQVQVFATSAVRSAGNGDEFLEEVHRQTGLRVQVIGGRTEAELIFRGVAASGALDGAGRCLVMDIGGGSVEFILARRGQIEWLESFEIGAQRLMDQFMQTDPVDPARVEAMDAYLEENLLPLLDACRTQPPQVLVGASGSFDTLHDIARHAGRLTEAGPFGAVETAYVRELKETLCRLSRPERLAIPGMIEMRVEMIVMALCLLDFVVRRTGAGQVRCSQYALKEGALLNGQSTTDSGQ